MRRTLKHSFKYLLLLLTAAGAPALRAQVVAYQGAAVFNIPSGQPYLETYLTLVGSSLKARKAGNKFQHSVSIVFSLYKDTTLIKANKYNLQSPLFASDTLGIPAFIDMQRYPLTNGSYEAHFLISDNNDPASKPALLSSKIEVNFSAAGLQFSALQPLESYRRTNNPGPLTKSGFDMVPYTVNYYPESTRELAFYLELYNAALMMGQDQPFIYNYYLETAAGQPLSSYGSFRRQNAKDVNPLLAKMDISKLGTGDYNLVFEIRDDKNTVRLQKKYFFQRLNRSVDVAELQNNDLANSLYPYFGNCNNADTLKMLVECLWPIADGVDKERIINQSIKKDKELMKRFVVDFWTRRAADTANPVKLWGKYYKEVQTVMALFKCGKQPGYYTDRGRVYLQYGAPSQRSQQPNEPNTYPYEIWQYYRTSDATNGQFFSNRKFVFVNRTLGDDCFSLVHSDMRGEVNNPRWQFEVTRRNNNGISNPDNTVPSGTQDNQFREIYSNPR